MPANKRASNIDPSHNGLLEAVHESINPDGPNALAESLAALDQMSTALSDVLVFWENHIDKLAVLSSVPTARFPFTSEELTSYVDAWKRHQTVLLTATSSISASSDAVTVNAPGAPSRTERGEDASRVEDENTRSMSLWQCFKRFFSKKGPH
jgi:hypothetical protein